MKNILYKHRVNSGFASAEDFSAAFNLNVATYIEHENGSKSLDINSATRYAECLDINPLDLLNVNIKDVLQLMHKKIQEDDDNEALLFLLDNMDKIGFTKGNKDLIIMAVKYLQDSTNADFIDGMKLLFTAKTLIDSVMNENVTKINDIDKKLKERYPAYNTDL